MRPDDRQEFAKLMAGLCLTFEKEPAPALVEIYWTALSDLSIDEVRRAVMLCMRDSSHWPRPADLRSQVVASREAQATLAWEQVQRAMPLGAYRHISFHDGVINATIRSMGGWPALFQQCATTDGEKWYRIEFERRYKHLTGRASDEACAPLPGLSEASVYDGKRCMPRITVIGENGRQKLLPPVEMPQRIEGRSSGGVARIGQVLEDKDGTVVSRD